MCTLQLQMKKCFKCHRPGIGDKYWKRCILHSVLKENGKYCSTKSMSQWDLCVHGYSLKVQQWSSTPNGILARPALKSGLLYIKHHVREIHLDSYTFFYFFPTAVSYFQIIYKWVGGMSASRGVPEHGESMVIDTLAGRQLFSSEGSYGEGY